MRPRVSVVMTCYRQEAFVAEAVRSLLAQDYHPLEVVLSDDASPDATWDVLREVVGDYTGPHEVVVRRNQSNLGPNAHNGVAFGVARGEFLVRAHGDDVSEPHRVRRLVETWRARRPTLISSNALLIDGESAVHGQYLAPSSSRGIALEHIVEKGWDKPMLGASYAWEKRLFDTFGPIDRRILPRGGDHLLPFRAALLGGMFFLDEPLVRYRQHAGQQTRAIADRTQGDDVFMETLHAHNVTARLAMLHDLSQLRRAGVEDERLARARERLMARIVGETRHWVQRRNTLLLRDQRPTWVDREILDAVEVDHAFEPESPAA